MTQKVHEYVDEFQTEYWAKKTANKRNITVEAVLEEWGNKKNIACEKGNNFHYYAENKMNNRYFPVELDETLKAMFDKFYTDSFGTLIPVKSELVVGDKELDIAGSIDQLFWSNKKNGLVIFDWKTNTRLSKKSRYNKKMRSIFKDYDDCEFSTYSVQLNLYKYIIERNTNLKIIDLYLCWFNKDNISYELIQIPDMTDKMNEMFL